MKRFLACCLVAFLPVLSACSGGGGSSGGNQSPPAKPVPVAAHLDLQGDPYLQKIFSASYTFTPSVPKAKEASLVQWENDAQPPKVLLEKKGFNRTLGGTLTFRLAAASGILLSDIKARKIRLCITPKDDSPSQGVRVCSAYKGPITAIPPKVTRLGIGGVLNAASGSPSLLTANYQYTPSPSSALPESSILTWKSTDGTKAEALGQPQTQVVSSSSANESTWSVDFSAYPSEKLENKHILFCVIPQDTSGLKGKEVCSAKTSAVITPLPSVTISAPTIQGSAVISATLQADYTYKPSNQWRPDADRSLLYWQILPTGGAIITLPETQIHSSGPKDSFLIDPTLFGVSVLENATIRFCVKPKDSKGRTNKTLCSAFTKPIPPLPKPSATSLKITVSGTPAIGKTFHADYLYKPANALAPDTEYSTLAWQITPPGSVQVLKLPPSAVQSSASLHESSLLISLRTLPATVVEGGLLQFCVLPGDVKARVGTKQCATGITLPRLSPPSVSGLHIKDRQNPQTTSFVIGPQQLLAEYSFQPANTLQPGLDFEVSEFWWENDLQTKLQSAADVSIDPISKIYDLDRRGQAVVDLESRKVRFCVLPKDSAGRKAASPTCSTYIGPIGMRPGNTPPVFTSVTILGSILVDTDLEASGFYQDAEGDLPATPTYAWFSNGQTVGTNDIIYHPPSSATGQKIKVCMTPKPRTGNQSGVAQVCSLEVGPLGVPTIQGLTIHFALPAEGSTLEASPLCPGCKNATFEYSLSFDDNQDGVFSAGELRYKGSNAKYVLQAADALKALEYKAALLSSPTKGVTAQLKVIQFRPDTLAITAGKDDAYETVQAGLLSDNSALVWRASGVGNPHVKGSFTHLISNPWSDSDIKAFPVYNQIAALTTSGSVVFLIPDSLGPFAPANLEVLNGGSAVNQVAVSALAFAFLNAKGQMGIMPYSDWYTPAFLDTLLPKTTFTRLVASYNDIAAVTSSGSLLFWGKNTLIPASQSTSYPPDPAILPDLAHDIKEIYATKDAFAALTTSGSVIVWGDPKLGGSLTAPGEAPGKALHLQSGVQSIIASRAGFAAIKANRVVAWGGGGTYNLPDAVATSLNPGNIASWHTDQYISNNIALITTSGSVVVVGGKAQIPLASKAILSTGVQDVIPGADAFVAVTPAGLHAWGDATLGGNMPAAIQAQTQGITEVHASMGAFAALTQSGSVLIWGSPKYGGVFTPLSNPVFQSQLVLNKGAHSLVAQPYGFSVIMPTGMVYSWGRDSKVINNEIFLGSDKDSFGYPQNTYIGYVRVP